MKVGLNNLLYDDADSRCMCIISSACGQVYAFIQVIDLGGGTKRYWGPYTHDKELQSKMIMAIMETGGKWPKFPKGE